MIVILIIIRRALISFSVTSFRAACCRAPLLRKHVEDAGLIWRDAQAFGQDYARTLSEWTQRFLASWDAIAPLGFDDRFKKLWRFYLAYCEAGFRAESTDVVQVSVAR